MKLKNNYISLNIMSFSVVILLFIMSSNVQAQAPKIIQNGQEYYHISQFTPLEGSVFKWYPQTGVLNIQTQGKVMRLFSGKGSFYAGFNEISFTVPLIQIEKDPYISSNFLKTILNFDFSEKISEPVSETPGRPLVQAQLNQPVSHHKPPHEQSLHEQPVLPLYEQSEQPLHEKPLHDQPLHERLVPESLPDQSSDIFSGMNLEESKEENLQSFDNGVVISSKLTDIIMEKADNALFLKFIFESSVPENSFSRLDGQGSYVLTFINAALAIPEKLRIGVSDLLISKYFADISGLDINIIFSSLEPLIHNISISNNTVVLKFTPLVEDVSEISETDNTLNEIGQKPDSTIDNRVSSFENPDTSAVSSPLLATVTSAVTPAVQSTADSDASHEPGDNIFDSEQINSSDVLDLVTVLIDPGHGGRDTGITVEKDGHRIFEKDISLGIALYLSAYLEKAGARVIMTRKEDIFVPASQRIKAMSDENINFCISIHSGYSPNKDNRGSLVFLKGPESLKIAELIQNNLYGLMHGHFTEPKPIKAYIFSETRTACCLLETGFLSNESDLEYILKKEGQKSIAKAIYRAIASSGN